MIDHGETKGGATPSSAKDAKLKGEKPVNKPDWANGLKQFYDSVVDEPLPDDLASLLAKLDGDGDA